MARFPLPAWIKGLSTLVDTGAGDPQASPDVQDVRGHTGVLSLRKGFRVLDLEPSHIATGGGSKTFGYLAFDGVNDYARNTAWTQTLGSRWTIRIAAYAVSISGINDTNGTRTLFQIYDGSQQVVSVNLIGVTSGSTCQVSVFIRDSAGNSVTLTSAARTTAAWVAARGQHGVAQIRIVRDGSTCYLYVGETLEDSDSGFSNNPHSAGSTLIIGDGAGLGNPCQAQFMSLAVVNRVLSEYEAYWNICWPTDAEAEVDVLGNWPFAERTGTSVADYSSYGDDLTITGATWNGSLFNGARGLGIFSWRRANGDIYHAIGCTRRGTSSAGANPSGAVYTWKADQNFTPFYFGGDPGNDDATAGLSGLDPFARICFQQGRDMLLLSNGTDFNRKYLASFQYLGGTAPPTAPIVVTAGGSGITATWLYAYSYLNSVTKTETGLSPLTSISITDDAGTTVSWFLSSDTQFDRVRIYRTKNAETGLYLLTEQAMATASYSDTKTDANLAAGPLAPGADLPGNRVRKRAFLAFPDFRVDDPVTGPQKGPVAAPTLAESGTASVDAGVHYFAYSYYDSTNGVETGMSPAAAITASGAKQVDISALVLPPETTRYNQMRIYRTKAGARTWFLDQTITAATTATSTQADTGLTSTIETYSLPPKFEGMCVFANRLWGFVGDRVYWSTQGHLEDHPEANGYSPKAGVRIRAVSPTEGAMFFHFEDGTLFMLPHPGDEPDLTYFVPLNLRQFSPYGATVGHFTVQPVAGGLIWLAKDGFFFGSPSGLQLISPQITTEFLDLNSARGKYACSMYDGTRGIYRCWVSRGNNRLNEECFVFYVKEGSWWLDNLHADAAGILLDGKQNPHYCFLVENGVLNELDESVDYDGDGTGTLSGTVTSPFIGTFSDIVGRNAPNGGDGGYPIWLVKSDGTMAQRYKLDPMMDPRGDVDGFEIFYPSYSGLTSGTWTAYFHGIRGYIKTMLLHLGDMRLPKNLTRIFFFNRVQSAGGLQVNLSADEAAFASMDSDVDLTLPVSQVTTMVGSGRAFQLEVYSDPPAASRPWALKGVEIDATVDSSDVGTD